MSCSMPLIHSDVFAQAFAEPINCIINGTRNGSIWSWCVASFSYWSYLSSISRRDTRMPCICTVIEESAGGGSICWTKYIHNRNSFIVARTDGQLQRFDIRVNKCVTEYVGNCNTHYRVACAMVGRISVCWTFRAFKSDIDRIRQNQFWWLEALMVSLDFGIYTIWSLASVLKWVQ